MKPAVISGGKPAMDDKYLFSAVQMTLAAPKVVWSEQMVIGISNECGEIYGVTGLPQMSVFAELLRDLHRLCYTYDIVTARAPIEGLQAVFTMDKGWERNGPLPRSEAVADHNKLLFDQNDSGS